MMKQIIYINESKVVADRLKELNTTGITYNDINFFDAITNALITGDIDVTKYKIKKEILIGHRLHFYIYE